MKRTVSFTATAILLLGAFLLSSCIIIPIPKKYKISPDDVSSIELYDLRESAHSSDALKDATPVYELPTEKIPDFLEDLSKVQFTDTIIIVLAAIDPSFVYGDWVVRINYTDGSYQMLSSGGFNEKFDKNGDRTDANHYSCDDEEWEAFVKKYVPSETFKKL